MVGKPEHFVVVEGVATVPDLIVLVRDGKVVGRVQAKLDLNGVPVDLWQCVPVHRITLGLPSEADVQDMEIRERNLPARLAKWAALPWWRKLWTPKPTRWDDDALVAVEDTP